MRVKNGKQVATSEHMMKNKSSSESKLKHLIKKLIAPTRQVSQDLRQKKLDKLKALDLSWSAQNLFHRSAKPSGKRLTGRAKLV